MNAQDKKAPGQTLTILCGALWGAGLARALALELPSALFFQWPGALGAALLAALLAFSLSRALKDAAALAFVPLALPLLDLLSGDYVPWRGPVLLVGGVLLTALLLWREKFPRAAWLTLAIALPLAIYLPDLSPYVGRADTFEFQVVAPRLGIAHPSGYPLYILVGKLFSLLPVGSSAWRINLSSAVCGALAAGALYLALTERDTLTREQHLVALLTAWTLALSPTLWSRAIEAEVYTLNALLVALALWAANRWLAGRLPARLALPLLGLLAGVGMASHLTLGALLFLAAPLALQMRPSLKQLGQTAMLVLLGLAIYLYIPLRWPAINHGELMTPAHFLRFVTNAESGGALHPLAFIQDPPRWALVFRLLRLQVGWGGLGLAALGFVHLLRRRWALALGTLLAGGAWVWFNLSFYVADPDYSAFLIPAHVLLLFWLGEGALWLMSQLHERRAALAPLALTALALLPLSRLWLTGPTLDTHAQGLADETWGREALRQPLTQNAAILADSEKFPPLYFLQQVEGLRPDLDLVMRFDEAGYREELHARLAAGQPVYLARYLPGMDAYGVQSVGPLVAVGPLPTAVVDGATFGEALRLLNHTLVAAETGRQHRLNLTWQATDALTDELTVRLRLRDARGAVAWQSEERRPVAGYTTTQAWSAGQVINDSHALAWPAWLPGGRYTLEIAVGPRFAEALMPGWVALTELTLPWAAAPEPATPLRALFGAHLWLEGFDLPGEVAAESQLHFTLTGRRTADLPEEARPQFYWMPLDNARWEPPVIPEAALSANAWPQGQRVQQRYTLTAPWLPGQYRLWVSWNAGGEPLPARCGWLARAETQCALADLTVGPATAGLANFGGELVLVDSTFDVERLAPEETLAFALQWRGLRAMTADYTLFVQLLGPDGRLYGQVDTWPVQGARPTSGWTVGEELSDPHRLTLASDAPPGEYQVIVGWYLLGTMERLTVRDAAGQAVGDFYTLGTFTVGE